MNALPSRAAMLPRCQAAKTALHINNEELLTPTEVFSCEYVDLFVCSSGAFLKVQANSSSHPSREMDEPPRQALRTAQEFAGAGPERSPPSCMTHTATPQQLSPWL